MIARRSTVLWFGPPPLPGLVARLTLRGLTVVQNPDLSPAALSDVHLSSTRLVVFNHEDGSDESATAGYACLSRVVDHGVPVLVLAKNASTWAGLRERHLEPRCAGFPWDRVLKFMPDCTGVHFDEFVAPVASSTWHDFHLDLRDGDEGLSPDKRLLVQRAFPKAEQLILREIPKGLSGSRVFMAYEKRKEDSTSIAHWTQPRLVKVGLREAIRTEITAMQAVSPFIPFDLRPNLDIHVEGLMHGVFVADFVDGSQSLLEAAHAGRAEAALSNLFNRTMSRWRERGWQREKSPDSLAVEAERLDIMAPKRVRPEYANSTEVQEAGIDVAAVWTKLTAIRFHHRVATIHGDLHGDNVRVRGDDAVLIDLGSVRGNDEANGGAPLCFDVAMLEVALVFTFVKGEPDPTFAQTAWRQEITPYYQTDAIGKALEASSAPRDGGWMLGCLQRIRAFGVYEQDDACEYSLALAIAMLRMCKFEPTSDADKGRRVYGLLIAARIIEDVYTREKNEGTLA
jgi:hypothetical protein